MIKNNSKSMKAVVESYLIEETAELCMDQKKLKEWENHVKQLNLTGQKEIRHPKKSPIPFLYMKNMLFQIFDTLCPVKEKIENYSISPIPLEILFLVGLSKKEKYFNEIQIWYDDKNPDPVCVGLTCDYVPVDRDYHHYYNVIVENEEEAIKYLESIGKEPYENYDGKIMPMTKYNEKLYLIGRWGDEKKTFEILKEQAKKRYIFTESIKWKKQIKEARRNLADLELNAEEKYN